MRPILVVRNALVSARGHVLLGLRSDLRRWEAPGGKVEDESVVEAAVREQREETGMTLLGAPECLGYADGLSLKKPSRRFAELYLLWSDWSGDAAPMEAAQVRWEWFPLDSLPPPAAVMPGSAHLLSSLLPKRFPGVGNTGRAA